MTCASWPNGPGGFARHQSGSSHLGQEAFADRTSFVVEECRYSDFLAQVVEPAGSLSKGFKAAHTLCGAMAGFLTHQEFGAKAGIEESVHPDRFSQTLAYREWFENFYRRTRCLGTREAEEVCAKEAVVEALALRAKASSGSMAELMVTIRPLAEADSIFELTLLLHRAYARLGNMGLNYTAVDQSPEFTAKRIHGGSCFVALIEAELVGAIVVQPTYSESKCPYFTKPGVACAHQFAVSPQHQGKGIGRMLLEHAEHWARQAGFNELVMDTAEQAKHLIELYGGLGYRRVGAVHWPGKVYQSVVMSKPLVGLTGPLRQEDFDS